MIGWKYTPLNGTASEAYKDLETFITESIKAAQLEILEKVRPHEGLIHPWYTRFRKQIDQEISRLKEAAK